MKAGIVHVQPPVAVLEQMITARVHLDDCDASSGALLVLPGSHREGILDDQAVDAWQHRMPATTCAARAGDVLLMRPLLLHSSKRAENPLHRRVVHLEFAACNLPGGLQWCDE